MGRDQSRGVDRWSARSGRPLDHCVFTGEDAMIKRSARSGRPAIHTSALISTHASSTNLATSTNTLNGPDSFSSECRCRTAIAVWCRATVDKGLSDHWREVACDSRSENAPSTGCRCNHARAGSAITLGKVSRERLVLAGGVPADLTAVRIEVADRFATVHLTAPGCSEMDCCEAVCNFDPYCCQISWDASCKNKALSGNFPECDG